jgi:recyclin-1
MYISSADRYDPKLMGLLVLFSFKMFEFNMDEYLDEEIDWVKDSMDQICKEWDAQVSSTLFCALPIIPRLLANIFLVEPQLKNDSSKPHHTSNSANAQATFLASQNPAQVKRNVLAGFRDVLLLPVTIIPKTAVYVVSAGSTAAVSGLSMLNPQNWQGGNSAAIAKAAGTTDKMTGLPNGYGKSDEINAAVFELGDDDEEHRGELNESQSALSFVLLFRITANPTVRSAW